MNHVSDLLAAHAYYVANPTDFAGYTEKLEQVMSNLKAAEAADKITAFDKIVAGVEAMLIKDEPYESNYVSEQHKMFMDDDDPHYLQETLFEAIFGPSFYDFYNKAYTGG